MGGTFLTAVRLIFSVSLPEALLLFVSYPFAYALPIIWAVYCFARVANSFKVLFFGGITLGVAWLVAHSIKLITQIPRPFVTENVVPLIRETGFSFPSEHAVLFSTLAVFSYFIDPKLGIIMGVSALAIALSRIGLNVHYPTDVVAGIVLGGAVGYLSHLVFTNFL